MKTLQDILKTAYVRWRIRGLTSGSIDPAGLANLYRWRRRKGGKISNTVEFLKHYQGEPIYEGETAIGAPDKDGHRWINAFGPFGLRFSGYSDAIVSLRHTGHYTTHHPMEGSTYRGCVLQLPGKRKHTRYLAAYHDNEGGGYVVDFSRVFDGEHDQEQDSMHRYNAARAGDRMAEYAAQESCDHDDKWQMAKEWQELGEELETETCEKCRAELQRKMKAIADEFGDIEQFTKENF